GNNGGDAFAALASLGKHCERVVIAIPTHAISAARADAQARASAAGVRTVAWGDDACATLLARAELFLDGLYGSGARLPLDENTSNAIAAMQRAGAPVLAIDLPTGVEARDGSVPGNAVRAGITVALGALTPGHLLDPAREYVGRIVLADIGFPPDLLAAAPYRFATLDDDSFRALAPQRDARADKRGSGSVLVVAGSEQFPGAAILCARAAMRAGAGYVTLAAPKAAVATLRAHLVEEVVVELPADSSAALDLLLDIERRNSALAIGPGLGLDAATGELVTALLSRTSLPAVVDASALFHLAKRLEPLRGRPVLLTPHAGEFARLSGEGTVAQGARATRLRSFVERTGVTTLLKGRDTLVDDGTLTYVNPSGTNALATAGSGDVLTGIVAALLARGCSPHLAGALGAFWHGRAGQLALERRHIGVIASDIFDALGGALP
ncbi:MAG TPA: NAD(P)H-hydrate dehydratase, partial [Candidatus Dormibacteraeota bacterium]|nr:NAD(P)H-hydrate dehydratase [Candidatus Dormibacteraeota bacterium]